MAYCGGRPGEVLADAAHEPRAERDVSGAAGWTGSEAENVANEHRRSGSDPGAGVGICAENVGEVVLEADDSVGRSSGDTEAEDESPDSSPRAPGDAGEGGAGAMDGETLVAGPPAVFRSKIHCSR